MTIKILALNNANGEVAGYLLRKVGRDVQVSTAVSEQNALQQLQREHFDLLILEYHNEMFLERWRSITQSSDTLTLVLTPKDGPSGFVRVPLRRDEANAYMLFPCRFDTFLDVINKLLAGVSTQLMPGDEGYATCESADLAVVFEYPSFWIKPERLPYMRMAVRRSYISIVGPKNRRDGPPSAIEVSKYCTHDSMRVEPKVALIMEFEGYKNLNQIVEKRTVEIGGNVGTQAEYIWLLGNNQGRSIVATIEKDENVYVLHLSAAGDRFDDLRPVYAHLLETFRFLD